MSLINQALKKEQIRRDGREDLRNVPLPPAHRAMVAKGNKSDSNTKIVIGVCAAGAALMVLVVIFSIAGVKRIIAGSEDIVRTAHTTEATHALSEQITNTQPETKPAQTAPVQANEPPAVAQAEAPVTPATSEPISEAPISQEVAKPQPNPSTQQFLESIQFQAVRLAKENSRLLLDGRVYKIGNLIGQGEHRLVFKGVEGSILVFEDDNGATYKINA